MNNTFSVEILVEKDWINLPEAGASTWNQADRNFSLVRKLYSARPARLVRDRRVIAEEGEQRCLDMR